MSRRGPFADGAPSEIVGDRPYFGASVPVRRRGIAVALVALVRAVPCLVALPILQACLITQHVEIDPPDNFPPSVLDPLSPPLGYRPIGSHIDLSAIEGGDAGPPTSITFEVAVRDPDIEQRLDYAVWINYPTPTGSVTRGQLPPDSVIDSDRRVRTLSFTLPIRELGACNRVELRVSGGFQFIDQREPVTEGDVATATWWIVDDRTVSISDCPEAP
jgi:hypothetical protein